MTKSNIVLLIDADNANAKYIDMVIKDLQERGNIYERLIFGDWKNTNLSSWDNAILKYALKQNQQNSYVKGKNATDIAMVISAMELLYTRHNIDTFAIMSSDSDFTPLVQKLRQANKKTIGFVGNNTSEFFIQACDEVVLLLNQNDKTIKEVKQKSDDIAQTAHINHKEFDNNSKQKILLIIEQLMDKKCDGGFVSSSILGQELVKNNITAQNFGFKTLRELLDTLPELEITFIQEKNNYYYRLKNDQTKQQKIEITDRKEKINNNKKLLDKINQAFDELSKNNDWLAVSLLGSKLGGADYSLKTKNYGYKNWSILFKDLNDYEKNIHQGRLMVRKINKKENKKSTIISVKKTLIESAKNQSNQSVDFAQKSEIFIKNKDELLNRIIQAINSINPNGFVSIIDINNFLRKEYGVYTYQYFSGSTTDFIRLFPQKFRLKKECQGSLHRLLVAIIK